MHTGGVQDEPSIDSYESEQHPLSPSSSTNRPHRSAWRRSGLRRKRSEPAAVTQRQRSRRRRQSGEGGEGELECELVMSYALFIVERTGERHMWTQQQQIESTTDVVVVPQTTRMPVRRAQSTVATTGVGLVILFNIQLYSQHYTD
jgi:hypothetical protein